MTMANENFSAETYWAYGCNCLMGDGISQNGHGPAIDEIDTTCKKYKGTVFPKERKVESPAFLFTAINSRDFGILIISGQKIKDPAAWLEHLSFLRRVLETETNPLARKWFKSSFFRLYQMRKNGVWRRMHQRRFPLQNQAWVKKQ